MLPSCPLKTLYFFTCTQPLDNQQDSSPDWDKVYPLLDSPVQEKLPFIGECQESQNEITAADELKGSKISEVLCFEEAEKSALEREKKAPHDSVGDIVKLRGSSSFQESSPNIITETESSGKFKVTSQSDEYYTL